jgi:hypothetical protein
VASAAAFFRVPRAVDAVSAGSAAALRPPATGNSKDRWRRSEAVPAHLLKACWAMADQLIASLASSMRAFRLISE